MRYAVIMAGGAGKRLWPMSRLNRPKQLLPLLGGKSLLESTVERLKDSFDPENIWVITNAEYADQVRAALAEVPDENVVGEPVGRDTSNAIALAAELLAARDPEATMAVFTADHVIRPVDQFSQSVQQACRTAEENIDALVTLGIRPTWPHTGLGYIETTGQSDNGVYQVDSFREKPDHQTARQYVDSGRYFWNSGMFIWTLRAIRGALNQYLPASMKALEPVAQAAREGKDYQPILEEVYPGLEKISIDYAVMEKARSVKMVELTAVWLDVGSWPALSDVSDLDNEQNVVSASNAALLNTRQSIVVSEDDHLIALLGMEDCIVVRTPDATLVCNRNSAQQLKQLLEQLDEKYL
ncbi:MAG: mannose-1-phosphate guanylyltransferase [Phycisphaerae bacterium]